MPKFIATIAWSFEAASDDAASEILDQLTGNPVPAKWIRCCGRSLERTILTGVKSTPNLLKDVVDPQE
jgi:hypothetical protein